MDEAAIEEQMAPDQNIPAHIPNQAAYAVMRPAPSASPPITNGAMPYHQRQRTPQPQLGSRPASRNAVQRPGANLGPPVSHPQNVPNGYAYMQNHNIFHPHGSPGMPGQQHPGQQHPQHPQHPQYQYQQHQQPHPQMQQQYMQDQRRQSVPPSFPPVERPRSQPPPQQQPQPPPMPRNTPSPPQPEPERRPDTLQPQQSKPNPGKSRSIFTPIDDSRSLLAQHWGPGPTTSEPKQEALVKQEKDRSQSVDISSMQRSNPPVSTAATIPAVRPQRVFSQPQRTQSTASLSGDSKRPRLKVQIPSEQSDDGGSPTAGSSPRQTEETASTPAKGTETSHSSGIHLPPPSPSASALLSAGATGPSNPFARPLPPGNASVQNTQAYNNNNNTNNETPISALPSRFVAEGLLPSPSSFYPEWGFGRGGDSNMMPSPLNYQTPSAGTGPNFSRDEDADRKRKSPEGDVQQQEMANVKRIKA